MTCLPWIESTLIELSLRLATSARLPARLIDRPEGCLPTATVSISLGGLVVRSITYSLLSGTAFQFAPSGAQSIEFATRPSVPSGVTARLVGGPKIEFISGRLATMRGWAGSVPMSTIVTTSLPGATLFKAPSSAKTALVSTPTSMNSGLPEADGMAVEQAASSAVATAVARSDR